MSIVFNVLYAFTGVAVLMSLAGFWFYAQTKDIVVLLSSISSLGLSFLTLILIYAYRLLYLP